MEVCYVVTFKPQEVRSYSAELVVVTEREKFIVPVGALGHRAVLDFPDQVGQRRSSVWGGNIGGRVVWARDSFHCA